MTAEQNYPFKSEKTSHFTHKATKPELNTKVVYSSKMDKDAGVGNQMISSNIGDEQADAAVEVSRAPIDVLPLDHTSLAGGTGVDTGSGYSLRKIRSTSGENKVIFNNDILDQITDEDESFLSNPSTSQTLIPGENPGELEYRKFSLSHGAADTHRIDWIKENDKKVGFKLSAEMADNGYTEDAATIVTSVDGFVISNIRDDIMDNLDPNGNRHTKDYGTMTSAEKALQGLAIMIPAQDAILDDAGRKYNRRFYGKYISGGTTYSSGRYEITGTNEITVASGNPYADNTTFTNVRIKFGTNYGQVFRIYGFDVGTSYRVKCKARLLTAGMDTELVDTRMAVDVSDNNDRDEPFAALRTRTLFEQNINLSVTVKIEHNLVNGGAQTDLVFDYTGGITKRVVNGEQVRDPIYRTADLKYQLYADGNGRWKIAKQSESGYSISICFLKSSYFTNSTTGASITRTPVDFPSLTYWDAAAGTTLSQLEVSVADAQNQPFQDLAFTFTYSKSDADHNVNFDAGNNTSSKGWVDFGIYENGNSTRGLISGEVRDIEIIEEPDVICKIRRTSDNCHADVILKDTDELTLDSPIVYSTQLEDRSNVNQMFAHIDSRPNDPNGFGGQVVGPYPFTQATTLREFIEEEVIDLETPFVSTQHDNHLNLSKFEVINEGTGLRAKAKALSDFQGGISGTPHISARINIPLSQILLEPAAQHTRFKLSFNVKNFAATGSVSEMNVGAGNSRTSGYGHWTFRDKTGKNIANSKVSSRGFHEFDFYSTYAEGSNLHLGSFLLTLYAGQEIEIVNIKLKTIPSIMVPIWYDQASAWGPRRRNAYQPNHRYQPVLVDYGELVTTRGKPALKFKTTVDTSNSSTGAENNDNRHQDRLKIGDLPEVNNNITAFLVASRSPTIESSQRTHSGGDYFFTFGVTGTGGATNSTFGIGYNTSGPVFTSASTGIQNSVNGSKAVGLEGFNNGGIASILGTSTKTYAYLNGSKVGEIDTPTNAAGTHEITQNSQNSGGIGSHSGTTQGVEDGTIQELIIINKDVHYLRPHIEANLASHYLPGGPVPTMITRVKSLGGSYFVTLRINAPEYMSAGNGVVKFKYFLPSKSPFVGKYIHLGSRTVLNSSVPDTVFSSEPVGPLLENQWVSCEMGFGLKFGGLRRKVTSQQNNAKGLLFIANKTGGAGVQSSGASGSDEILFADIEVIKYEDESFEPFQNKTHTRKTYVEPSYKSGL